MHRVTHRLVAVLLAGPALAACGSHTTTAVGPTTSTSVPPSTSEAPSTSAPPSPTAPPSSRTATPTTPTTSRATPTPTRATSRAVPVAPAASYPATLRAVPASVTRAITVTASGYGTTSATLVAWTRSGSTWTKVYGPWTAKLGYTGLARPGAKREGDGHTPSGVYGFQYMFGIRANPGVSYTYRQVTGTWDVWDDDPSSARYNEWVDTRTADAGRSPEPMDNAPAYDYGAVIAYNTARTPGQGSAIFLHVSTGGSTAGCVSVPESELLTLLRWMRPGTDISIGVG